MHVWIYEIIYLLACGANDKIPDRKMINEMDLDLLYQASCAHHIDAIIGIELKKAGIDLPKKWDERIAKAVRKNILFDVERKKIETFFEDKGIWYLPLKGIVLKEYYPMVGMRQMSDIDILFDPKFREDVHNYMERQGYTIISVEKTNHDAYKKEPIYSIELHLSLYSNEASQKRYASYYRNVKERLMLDEGSLYRYHFSTEDFYVYILSHAHKHYAGGGTGIRSLLDIYIYLKAKEMDFAYIEKECELLGIAGFEKQNRILCRKLFDMEKGNENEKLEQKLDKKEIEMLRSYMFFGMYGTKQRKAENRVKKFQEENSDNLKLRFLWSRIIPEDYIMETYYNFFYRHKLLLPIGYVYRLLKGLVVKEKRTRMKYEVRAILRKK